MANKIDLKYNSEFPGEAKSPVREYRTIINDSGGTYVNRVLVGTPSTGTIRIEWAAARYGQVIPVNWSAVQMVEMLDSFIPLRYQVADAQNLIVQQVIEKDFEWLLLIESDVVLPADCFIRMNQYMREEQVPVVSGLYYTKSEPSEPLVFRGRGTSYFGDWKLGDKVWVDGVPTGILLIHGGIIREMYNDSPEYNLRGQTVRRVFRDPRDVFHDPETMEFSTMSGTSDLDWCTRVIEGDYIRKAGWTDFWDKLEDKRFPFLVDTNIFCKHIDPNGLTFPVGY